ncbi:hypothetical protein RB195_010457 [Necator americanus]|uniref:RGS domain-containing protein n=1 Tax=Necator americanus TaxID=51031 RepID=A0ABR1CZA9_NECAM
MNAVLAKLELLKKERRAGIFENLITAQGSSVLPHSVDDILGDSLGMTFFIHFLESCDRLNLVKFWTHVNGFKTSLGEDRTESLQKAELSLALLDARNIYDKYIDGESASSISFPWSISERVLSRLSEEHLAPNIFDEAARFVRDLFELRYYKEFRNSIYFKKYQLRKLSQGCSVEDVLHVPALLLAFLEFIDDHHDHDNIQFLLACNAFELNYDSLADNDVLEDAICIYDKYFSMQALTPLRVDVSVRQAMESEICSDSGRPLRSSFLSVKELCMDSLREKYLGRFVQSPGYQNYLIELEGEVQNMIELPLANRDGVRAGSSSSDSLPVTLCANFEAADCKRASVKSAMYSPLLTRQNRSLNLAEIDCMGQYHVLYDDSLAQDSNTPSRIRRKLRKYLDKSTLKEEEVAVEVARTIIADEFNSFLHALFAFILAYIQCISKLDDFPIYTFKSQQISNKFDGIKEI